MTILYTRLTPQGAVSRLGCDGPGCTQVAEAPNPLEWSTHHERDADSQMMKEFHYCSDACRLTRFPQGKTA